MICTKVSAGSIGLWTGGAGRIARVLCPANSVRPVPVAWIRSSSQYVLPRSLCYVCGNQSSVVRRDQVRLPSS